MVLVIFKQMMDEVRTVFTRQSGLTDSSKVSWSESNFLKIFTDFVNFTIKMVQLWCNFGYMGT